MNGLDEGLVSKAAVVCVVVLDVDAQGLGEGFEGELGGDCVVGGDPLVKIDEGESAEVVYEDSDEFVSFLGDEALHLRDETRRRRLHLIDGYALTWLCRCVDLTSVGFSLVSPRYLCCFSQLACGAPWNAAC